MKNLFLIFVIPLLLLSSIKLISLDSDQPPGTDNSTKSREVITLPFPNRDGKVSLEKAIIERKSIRNFSAEELNLNDVSQLLWAAQGITHEGIKRSAPSAGAAYPLELYVLSNKIKGLTGGIYKYNSNEHIITRVLKVTADKRLIPDITSQSWIADAPLVIVIGANYSRTEKRYGKRAKRYVKLEAGHAAQNILLQATAMNLGAVTVGSFNDTDLKSMIGMENDESPLYILPVGKIK
jgi:SagB-type dehydrogenase family enzyme